MIYRTEHPQPQFERDHWRRLNGEWEFDMDYPASGVERGLFKADAVYHKHINVPFCLESDLSGIGEKDFITSVWYRRRITVNADDLSGHVLLHIGAADYRTTVYVNEQQVGVHTGGYVSFAFDITEHVTAGDNTIVIHCADDTRDKFVPCGKQSLRHASFGCYYTRTTGIWQSVWLEYVPAAYIDRVRYTTDSDNGVITINANLIGAGTLTAAATFDGKPVGTASCHSTGGNATLSVKLDEIHLWEVGKGGLYDLTLTYGEDTVRSYCGLRTVTVDGNCVRINGRSVFQRLVLDQGYYPDGIYTAPTEEQLLGDIQCALALGFNGARLHQKVFEPRYLYHCDRLGFLVWGEYPSYGLDHTYPEGIYGILPEWLEVVQRDINHPSIITWCPFNESWDKNGRQQHDDLFRMLYHATKAVDPTRPCIDTSGNFHVITDIYDIHDYEQDPTVFASHYDCMSTTHDCGDFHSAFKQRQKYDGKMPFCVSEYGGCSWNKEAAACEGDASDWSTSTSWGYGNAPRTQEEFIDRFRRLTTTLMQNDNICAMCYTQLTDVEQEQNGLYYDTREPKFDVNLFKEILSQKAAIED